MFPNPPLPGNFAPQIAQNFAVPSNAISIAQPANEASLWIGNLSPSTTEDRIHALIISSSDIRRAPVAIKIMKDVYTGQSRRFGFVSFQSIDEAEKAKNALNYAQLDNFEIRISFKKSNSDFNQSANLFVGNIKKTISTRQLDELFSECGKIVSCSIRNNDKGESLGYGYVQFEKEEHSKEAIEKFNSNTSIGEPLKVEKFVSSKNRVIVKNNIYVRNFPKSFNKEKVDEFLKKSGESLGKIISIGSSEKELPNKQVSIAGFVALETEELAQQFIEKFNGIKLPEHTEGEEGLFVAICETKQTRNSKNSLTRNKTINNTNLIVKSVLDTVTQDQIMKLFGSFGEITSVCLRSNQPPFLPNGQTVQSVFINFKTADEASMAMMNAKKDPEIRKIIHPIHKKTAEFIFFHQPKLLRMEFNRMKSRYHQNIASALSFMMPGQMPMGNPGPFFKKGPFPMMPMMPQMGFIGNPTFPRQQFGPGRDFPGHSKTPQTDKNSHSGSTSRNGEEEETFTLEVLKARKDDLMKFDKEKQQNILGNIMYHKVLESSMGDKKLAPKITGMLIDLDILDINEIIEIMENKDILEERISEALEVIENTDE